MGSVWVTSDLHFGHTFAAVTLRGFPTVRDHDEEIIDRWNKLVRPGDIVWVLGDLSLNMSAGLAQAARLNGVKHLVWGNHDAGSPVYRDGHKHQRRYMDVFASADSMRRIRVDGQPVLLSHYPYAGDGERFAGQERYLPYRLRDEGIPLIHGHTHRPQRVTLSPTGTAQVHVGVDAWDLRPVPLAEAGRLIAAAGTWPGGENEAGHAA